MPGFFCLISQLPKVFLLSSGLHARSAPLPSDFEAFHCGPSLSKPRLQFILRADKVSAPHELRLRAGLSLCVPFFCPTFRFCFRYHKTGCAPLRERKSAPCHYLSSPFSFFAKDSGSKSVSMALPLPTKTFFAFQLRIVIVG